ncbi:Mur ligase family protein [Latilactobacillus sakei]
MQDEEMVTQLPGMLYGEDERVTLLRQILKAMGHPDHAFSIIHVCGTNGKGSTSAMIAAILQASGYSVGLFTSPHIMAVEESIQINRQLISKAQFARLLTTVQTVLKKLGFDPTTDLSYFETLVLVALVYFKQQQVDYVLWECGLGGALDATNAVDRVAYTLFTKISLDHMALLGDTIEAIATTKSKIIRPQTPVIVAPEQTKTTLHVLQAEVRRQSAPAADCFP